MGRKHTKETIEKMKKSATGIKRPRTKEWQDKITQALTGQKRAPRSENWCKNISKARVGVKPTLSEDRRKALRTSFSGENNPNWKGGITPLMFIIRTCARYLQWRTDVFVRDKFTCKECGDNVGGNLEADHIKKFAVILAENKIISLEMALNCLELWDINNGRTLCKDCHIKTDTYGRKTNPTVSTMLILA